jgi:hypothetical protein
MAAPHQTPPRKNDPTGKFKFAFFQNFAGLALAGAIRLTFGRFTWVSA